jgi:hypothetical protein
MNAKSQNISRILKITKHFVKETNFNKGLSKNNDSFYSEQLFNICSEHTPKKLLINSVRESSSKSFSLSQYYSNPKPMRILSGKSMSMPLYSNSACLNESIQTGKNINNKNKKNILHKLFFLSYNLDASSNKTIKLFRPNSSGRIINDVLFGIKDETEFRTFYYEEGNIFHNKILVFQRMKNSFNKILNFYKTYKSTFQNISNYIISKSTNVNSPNEVNFKITSVIIKLTNISNQKKYEFKIPLFLAPLFLYNPIKNIPTLLLSLISFKRKYPTISYDQQGDFYFVITSFYHSLMENQNNDNEKCVKFHEFLYFWITLTENYRVEVKMPLLTVTFKKTNSTVLKFIEGKLFFYLHDNNFVNWTFYVINYLYSFKNFRIVVNAISSKLSTSVNKYYDKNILLSEKKMKMNKKDDKQLIYFLSSENGNNFLLTINSMYFEITLNDNNNIHCYKSNNIKNSSLNKCSHKIKSISQNSRTISNKFIFTFQEANPLLKVHLQTDLLDFLLKFVNINHQSKHIEFNYKELISFPIQMLKNLSCLENSNYLQTKLYPDFSAKIVYPIFLIQKLREIKNVSKNAKDEKREIIYLKLKEFEMDTESIKILMKNGNIISNPNIIRKILFYLESEANKNDMPIFDEKTKRNLTMRKNLIRKKLHQKVL